MTQQILKKLMTSPHHILVLGAGRSGVAATKLLQKKGHRATLVDDLPALRLRYFKDAGLRESDKLRCFFNEKPVFDDNIDAVIVSPGIAPAHHVLQWARARAIPIVSEIDFGMAHGPSSKILGITGTNGKSTTTVMVETILKCAGLSALACGNLGRPLCDVMLDDDDHRHDFLVVELSSFQLEGSHALRLDGAIIVNISPDHLDRHASFDEYRDAKLKIASLCAQDAPIVVHDSLRELTRMHRNVHYFSGHLFGNADFAHLSRAPMRGFHNHENAMAAALLTRALGVNDADVAEGLAQFKALPHRCEIVLQKNHVLFINDSKGTTVEAVKKALDSFSQPIHLLLGGIAKGEDFSALNKIAFPHIKGYYVFGRDQRRIIDDLKSPHAHAFSDMAQALRAAIACAHAGDAILLSPGCASYDQFDDYQHRGVTFTKLAHQIMDELCASS